MHKLTEVVGGLDMIVHDQGLVVRVQAVVVDGLSEIIHQQAEVVAGLVGAVDEHPVIIDRLTEVAPGNPVFVPSHVEGPPRSPGTHRACARRAPASECDPRRTECRLESGS